MNKPQNLFFPSAMGPQLPMSAQQQAYWKMNTDHGQAANAAINQMPFVLDPAMLFGQTREQNMATMYSPKKDEAAPAAEPQPQDPMAQLMGLMQTNPELIPLIMQQMQTQQQNSNISAAHMGGGVGF